jgi:hypothetical protein
MERENAKAGFRAGGIKMLQNSSITKTKITPYGIQIFFKNDKSLFLGVTTLNLILNFHTDKSFKNSPKAKIQYYTSSKFKHFVGMQEK